MEAGAGTGEARSRLADFDWPRPRRSVDSSTPLTTARKVSFMPPQTLTAAALRIFIAPALGRGPGRHSGIPGVMSPQPPRPLSGVFGDGGMMSNDLYRVRVLAVQGERLTRRVTALYPRGKDDPPPSLTLALQFLWGPWRWFREGLSGNVEGGVVSPKEAEELGRIAPISPELAGKDVCDGDWTRANACRFISGVEVGGRRWLLGDRWGRAGEGPPEVKAPEGVVVELPETEGDFVVTATDPR